jgi:hypothetical protein
MISAKRAFVRLVISLAAVAAAAGCQNGSPPPEGTVYRSKSGGFTCKVPSLLRPGAKMLEDSTDSASSVEFMDDYGTLLRVESMKFPADRPEILSPQNPQRVDLLFDRSIMPNMFRAASPAASVGWREHLNAAGTDALFVVVNIPRGSTLVEQDTATSAHRLDSTRGVLMFMKDPYFYILQYQAPHLELKGGMSRPLAEQSEDLLKYLKNVVDGMTFP